MAEDCDSLCELAFAKFFNTGFNVRTRQSKRGQTPDFLNRKRFAVLPGLNGQETAEISAKKAVAFKSLLQLIINVSHSCF